MHLQHPTKAEYGAAQCRAKPFDSHKSVAGAPLALNRLANGWAGPQKKKTTPPSAKAVISVLFWNPRRIPSQGRRADVFDVAGRRRRARSTHTCNRNWPVRSVYRSANVARTARRRSPAGPVAGERHHRPGKSSSRRTPPQPGHGQRPGRSDDAPGPGRRNASRRSSASAPPRGFKSAAEDRVVVPGRQPRNKTGWGRMGGLMARSAARSCSQPRRGKTTVPVNLMTTGVRGSSGGLERRPWDRRLKRDIETPVLRVWA